MKGFTRSIRTEQEKSALIRWLSHSDQLPMLVTINPGQEKRSSQQNRLQWQWFNDAAGQGDQTATEYRAYCKLHFGVPILREENGDFREQYDRVIRPLPYNAKIALMLPPIELPVTSLMSVKQQTRYLDAIWQHFTSLGIQLTDPAMLGIDSLTRDKKC